MSITDDVRQFHAAFGAYVGEIPSIEVPDQVVRQRMDVIKDAALGAIWAMAGEDINLTAKKLADLVYVTFGAAVAYGIDLEDIVAEIHRSNMTLVPQEGDPSFDEEGKISKPDTFIEPDLEAVLHRQLQIKVAHMVMRQMAESESKAREIREGLGVE